MEKIGERIALLRGKKARKDFAQELGVPANTLRNYELGISLPNSEFIAKLCADFNVNPFWLLFGFSRGIEYPVNADDALPRPKDITKKLPKSGIYSTLSDKIDSFTARTSRVLVDVLKRNMHFYARICFAYYEDFSKVNHHGSKVIIIGERDESKYDIYDTNALCSSDDFFLVEFVSILFAAVKYDVKLYEVFTTRDEIDKTIRNIIKYTDGKDVNNGLKENYEIDIYKFENLFFSEPVGVPTILYGFYEAVPPNEDETIS